MEHQAFASSLLPTHNGGLCIIVGWAWRIVLWEEGGQCHWYLGMIKYLGIGWDTLGVTVFYCLFYTKLLIASVTRGSRRAVSNGSLEVP